MVFLATLTAIALSNAFGMIGNLGMLLHELNVFSEMAVGVTRENFGELASDVGTVHTTNLTSELWVGQLETDSGYCPITPNKIHIV